jgi:hypothetical protein
MFSHTSKTLEGLQFHQYLIQYGGMVNDPINEKSNPLFCAFCDTCLDNKNKVVIINKIKCLSLNNIEIWETPLSIHNFCEECYKDSLWWC